MLSKIPHFTILLFYTTLFLFPTISYSQENLILKNIGIELEAPGFHLLDNTSKSDLVNISKIIFGFPNLKAPTPSEIAVNEKGQGILFYKLPYRKLTEETKELITQYTDSIAIRVESEIEVKKIISGDINGRNYISHFYSSRGGKIGDTKMVTFNIEFDYFLLHVDFTRFTYNEALSIMESFKSITTSNSSEFQNEFKHLVKNKDYNAALRILNKEVKDNPKQIDLYEKRLLINSYLRDTVAMQSDINKLNNLDSENPISKSFEGHIKYLKGEFKNAILTLDEALTLFDKRHNSYDNELISFTLLALGDSYKALNLHDDALYIFNTVLEKDVDDDTIGTAYFKIGFIYQNQNKFQSAIENYDEALKLLPEESSALRSKIFFNRSSCHNMVSNSSQAIKDANNALLEDPTNYEAYLNLALAHAVSSNYLDGINYATKFINSKPIDKDKLGTAYFVKGSAQLMIDDFQDGCTNIKRAEEFKIPIPPILREVCD